MRDLLISIENTSFKLPRGLDLRSREFAHHRYLIRAGYAEWVPRPDFVELRINLFGLQYLDDLRKKKP